MNQKINGCQHSTNIAPTSRHAHIDIFRKENEGEACTGIVVLNSSAKRFCYSLEDKVREPGIKIYGKTAIPAGKYKWKVTYSPRFKRKMILIYNNDSTFGIDDGYGNSWLGIRMHGGNKADDSLGCPCVAYKILNHETIQSTAEKDLTKWAIEQGGEGTIEIHNSFQ